MDGTQSKELSGCQTITPDHNHSEMSKRIRRREAFEEIVRVIARTEGLDPKLNSYITWPPSRWPSSGLDESAVKPSVNGNSAH